MASKSKHVKVVIKNSGTGEKRTLNVGVGTPANYSTRTNPPAQRVVIVRGMPSLEKLIKALLKVR